MEQPSLPFFIARNIGRFFGLLPKWAFFTIVITVDVLNPVSR
jgi:hypothetical protein